MAAVFIKKGRWSLSKGVPIISENGSKVGETFREIKKIPNVLSLIRMIILPGIWISFSRSPEDVAVTAVLIGFSGVSDYFDGYFAKKFNIRTRIGLYLDPIADKATFAVISFALFLYRGLPLWVPIFIIAKDVVTLIFAYRLSAGYEVLATSNEIGRKTTVGLFLASLLYTLRVQPFGEYLLYLSLAGVAASLISYLYNFIRITRNEQRRNSRAA